MRFHEIKSWITYGQVSSKAPPTKSTFRALQNSFTPFGASGIGWERTTKDDHLSKNSDSGLVYLTFNLNTGVPRSRALSHNLAQHDGGTPSTHNSGFGSR